MLQFGKVSASEATALVAASVAEAEKINKQIAIAVCGPEGELIAFLRMDGANPASSRICQNKAYTASRDRRSTYEMGEYMRKQDRPPAFWGDLAITGFGGGMPIVADGKVIGGIGISGLTEEEDVRIANAAIKSVY